MALCHYQGFRSTGYTPGLQLDSRSQHQCRDRGSHRGFRHVQPSLLAGLRYRRSLAQMVKLKKEIAGKRGLGFKNAALGDIGGVAEPAIEKAAQEAPNAGFYNDLFRGLRELEVFISDICKLSSRMVDQDVTHNLVGIDRDVPKIMRYDCENGRVVNFRVFLSFRGPDTRLNLVKYLYDRLTSVGITTFLDSEEIEYGHSISAVIVDAIEHSDICVPVFSLDFATSTPCLMEVAQMVKSKKEILPIFFFVKPSDVKYQRGTYEKSFTEHGRKGRYPESIIQEWRKALEEIADKRGLEFKNAALGEISGIAKPAIEKAALEAPNGLFCNDLFRGCDVEEMK